VGYWFIWEGRGGRGNKGGTGGQDVELKPKVEVGDHPS